MMIRRSSTSRVPLAICVSSTYSPSAIDGGLHEGVCDRNSPRKLFSVVWARGRRMAARCCEVTEPEEVAAKKQVALGPAAHDSALQRGAGEYLRQFQ